MYPNLAHIYGPIYINSYGLAIAIGLIVFRYLLLKNPKTKSIISRDQFDKILSLSIFTGILGGRFLWAITNLDSINSIWDFFALWEAGYSVLGAIIFIILFILLYIKRFAPKVNALKLLDLAGIYTPLLHSISRIGCFLAGCCYGKPTGNIFGIIYTNPDVLVPNYLKFIKIHPTQLYSSLILLIIFFFMYFYAQNKFKKPGQLILIYLTLSSVERFFIDILRADHEYFNLNILRIFTIHQWISLMIFIISISLLIKLNITKKTSTKL